MCSMRHLVLYAPMIKDQEQKHKSCQRKSGPSYRFIGQVWWKYSFHYGDYIPAPFPPLIRSLLRVCEDTQNILPFGSSLLHVNTTTCWPMLVEQNIHSLVNSLPKWDKWECVVKLQNTFYFNLLGQSRFSKMFGSKTNSCTLPLLQGQHVYSAFQPQSPDICCLFCLLCVSIFSIMKDILATFMSLKTCGVTVVYITYLENNKIRGLVISARHYWPLQFYLKINVWFSGKICYQDWIFIDGCSFNFSPKMKDW